MKNEWHQRIEAENMKWCDKCGGPLFRWQGCRLCWLESWSSSAIMDADNSDKFARTNARWRFFMRDAGSANSTDNSPATSTWLPEGCVDHGPIRRYDADEEMLRYWLMYHRPIEIYMGGDFVDP